MIVFYSNWEKLPPTAKKTIRHGPVARVWTGTVRLLEAGGIFGDGFPGYPIGRGFSRYALFDDSYIPPKALCLGFTYSFMRRRIKELPPLFQDLDGTIRQTKDGKSVMKGPDTHE